VKEVDKTSKWKTLGSRVAYETPWLKIIEDSVITPESKKGNYSFVQTRGDAVFIVPISRDREVYLIGQFRYPTNNYSWEVPAGNAEGQDSLEAAKRELEEETGLLASSWEKVGSYFTANGFSSEATHLFVARSLKETGSHKQEEEGITAVKKVKIEEFFDLVDSGEISDGQTILAVLRALHYLGYLKKS